jgi:hypothetical protein
VKEAARLADASLLPRNCFAQRLHPPASGDTGIALVTCRLAHILLHVGEARRGEGTARHAADVADVACGPYRRKAPPRCGMLRLW